MGGCRSINVGEKNLSDRIKNSGQKGKKWCSKTTKNRARSGGSHKEREKVKTSVGTLGGRKKRKKS